MTQTKRQPAKKAVKKAAPKKKTAQRKPAATPAAKNGEKVNAKQPGLLVRPVFSPIKDLPTDALRHVLETVTKELENRKSGNAGGEQVINDTNLKATAGDRRTVMQSELKQTDFQIEVLYGSLQRLSKVVTRATGVNVDVPELFGEKESTVNNMVAAAKLSNERIQLINNSLNTHLEALDETI